MGSRVIARLNESLLIQAAQQSYGRYSLLTIGDADLRTTLGTSLPTEDATIEVEREFDVWADMGFWLCCLALLMLASFHRGLFAALLLTVMVPETSWAGQSINRSANQVAEAPAAGNPLSRLWQSLWLRPDQRATGRCRTVTRRRRHGCLKIASGAVRRTTEAAISAVPSTISRKILPKRALQPGQRACAIGSLSEAIERYSRCLTKIRSSRMRPSTRRCWKDCWNSKTSRNKRSKSNRTGNNKQSSNPKAVIRIRSKSKAKRKKNSNGQNSSLNNRNNSPTKKTPGTEAEDDTAERDEKQEA